MIGQEFTWPRTVSRHPALMWALRTIVKAAARVGAQAALKSACRQGQSFCLLIGAKRQRKATRGAQRLDSHSCLVTAER